MTLLRLEDSSGAIVIEAANMLRAPAAMFLDPPDAVMHEGSRVELAIAPSPAVLPFEFELAYGSDSGAHFTHSERSAELTEQGVAFVVPEVAASRGEISIRGVSGRSSPFRGAMRRSQGAEHCTITRAACYDGSCQHTTSYPNGFDVIRVEASVVGAE